MKIVFDLVQEGVYSENQIKQFRELNIIIIFNQCEFVVFNNMYFTRLVRSAVLGFEYMLLFAASLRFL